MKSKSFLKSKTFWLNALSAVATYSGFLPIDPQIATYILAGANVAVRVITKGPVHVLTDAATEP